MRAIGLCCLVLAGCTQVPELGAVVAPDLRAADYPALIPLGPDLRAAVDPGAEAEAASRALEARRDRLRRRAERLARTEVVDPASRERMKAGVAR